MSNYRLEKPFFYKGHMCYNLKNNDGKEYYKISPYEIDTGIYGEIYGKIDLNTSFNDSYYSKDSDPKTRFPGKTS